VKFKKRPIIIEAYRWDGDWKELSLWLDNVSNCGGSNLLYTQYIKDPAVLTCKMSEGTLTVALGDWIICGIDGEWYPCKPHIFELSYERVER
jgi:hypothetical protein